MEIQRYECKNCGADLDIRAAENGVIQCKSCKGVFTIPKKEVSTAALSFLRQGEHDLDTCKFEEAYSAFYKTWEIDKTEPEAFWGMALAEFKVRYIKDLVNNRLQPICHEVSEKNFCESKNYLQALKLATEAQRIEYEKKAAEIDYIKYEFYNLKRSGLDYDCFICVKVSGENGEKTDDYKDANYIYTLLQDKGYRPFFSERDIRNRTGADYEAMILYALYSSETMLIVCRNEDYLKTPWVKNEYTRFLKLVGDEEKESDSITIVYYGNPIEKLFGKKGKIQGIDFSSREADGKIVDFVEAHTPLARAKREEEKRKKEAQAEEIKKQIEAQKQAQKALEEKLKNLNSGVATSAAPTVVSLLTRANLELEAKNFEKGREYFEKVLECDPENSEAWFGLLLIDYDCSLEEELIKKIGHTDNLNFSDYEYLFKLTENKNYKFSKRWADEELSKRLEGIEKACINRIGELLNTDNVNQKARFFFETVAKSDESNAAAWYGLTLMDYGCVSYDQLISKIKNTVNTNDYEYLFSLFNNKNFQDAKRFAEKNLSNKLESISSEATNKINELLKLENINLKAKGFYEDVLKIMPNNAKAWYGLLLIGNGCISYNELTGKIANTTNEREYEFLFELPKSEYYLNAKKYASEALSKQLENISNACNIRIKELLKKINISIGAENFYEYVLNLNPNCVDALYAMMLLKVNCTSEKQLFELSKQREYCARFYYDEAVNFYVIKLCECENLKVKKHIENIREMCRIRLNIFQKEDEKNLLMQACYKYKLNSSKFMRSFITCAFMAISVVVLYFLIQPYVNSNNQWEWCTQNIALVVVAGITYLLSMILASAFGDSVQWSSSKDKNWRWFLGILFPPIFVAASVFVIIKNILFFIIRFFKWFIGIIPHLSLKCRIGSINKKLSELEIQLKTVQSELNKLNG